MDTIFKYDKRVNLTVYTNDLIIYLRGDKKIKQIKIKNIYI